MTSSHSVSEQLARLRDDSTGVRNRATQLIWERYSGALADVIRRHLSPRIRAREDEDDVLIDTYDSFCRRHHAGGFDVKNRNDLWKVLVTIATRKTVNLVKHHTRDKRDVRLEESQPNGDAALLPPWMIEHMDRSTPGPADAALLKEEFEWWLGILPENLRMIALWKFEGCSNREIADKLNRGERTVELRVAEIRHRWIVAEAAERFRAALRENYDVRAEDFLDDLGDYRPEEVEEGAAERSQREQSEHDDLLRELLRLEMLQEASRGRRPALEEYRQRFPKHQQLAARVFQDIFAVAPPSEGEPTEERP